MLTRNPATKFGTSHQTVRDRDVNIKIGETIRALRVASHASQKDLGDHLGVTFQQVQKYENGSNRVSASTLVEIAKFFGVKTSHFLGQFEGAADISPLSRVAEENARLRQIIANAKQALQG